MKFSLLIAIVSEEMEEKAREIAKEAGAGGVTILHGRGVGGEEKKVFWGVTYEGAQSVMIFILEKSLSLKVLKALKNGMGMDKGDGGVAFTLPLEHLAGIDMTQLNLFEENLKEEL